MAKIIEERHDGEPEWLYRFGNWSAKDPDTFKTGGYAWLFKENGSWKFMPRKTEDRSLFYNAVFFFRWVWPLGLFWAIRWMANGPRAYWQSGFGYKLNGRLALTFRIQGDESSEKGVTGPNWGQAKGFEYGPH